jgi:hypothetical protein
MIVIHLRRDRGGGDRLVVCHRAGADDKSALSKQQCGDKELKLCHRIVVYFEEARRGFS